MPYTYVYILKIYTFSTTPALGLKSLGCTSVIESTPPPIAHGTFISSKVSIYTTIYIYIYIVVHQCY